MRLVMHAGNPVDHAIRRLALDECADAETPEPGAIDHELALIGRAKLLALAIVQ